MDYNIRYAKESDSKVLGYIHSESWKVAYKSIIPDSILDNITAEKRERYFQKVLEEGQEEIILIFNKEKAVGFITLGKCRDEDLDNSWGEIWGIYLLPTHWNQGIGTKLIKFAIKELTNRSCDKFSLWVLEDNSNARKFYEKLGFEHDGTIKQLNIGKELNEFRYIKS